MVFQKVEFVNKKKTDFFKEKNLASLIIKLIILFSFLVTIVSSCIQGFLNYQLQKDIVTKAITNVTHAQVGSITESLWSTDRIQLNAYIQGILNYKYVKYVSVSENNVIVAEAGERDFAGIVELIPLNKVRGDEIIYLGALEIRTDSVGIFRDVLNQILFVLCFQAVSIFIVAGFVFFLFQKYITGHLHAIALHMELQTDSKKFTPLVVKKKKRGDEIDTLIEVYNRMQADYANLLSLQEETILNLQSSEERFRILVEEAPDAIVVYDSDKKVFSAGNKKSEDLFGCKREDFISSSVERFYTEDQPDGLPLCESIDLHNKLAMKGESLIYERKIKDCNGKIKYCEVRLVRIPTQQGNFLRSSMLDITDRKKAEEELNVSLREKETLIRELYHRTKNTLQVIRSMLMLQAEKYDDSEDIQQLVKTTEQRIQAISLVHKMLYSSNDLSKISFKEYISELAFLIMQTYNASEKGINLELEIDDHAILLDTAIPCGLIMNELVTNSMKYAFPNGRNGTITIKHKGIDCENIVLIYADDGIGVPKDFDFRKQNSMGLELILSLCERQLKGKVNFNTDHGLVCTMEFPGTLYMPRV